VPQREGRSWGRPRCPRPVLGPEPLVVLIGHRGIKISTSVGGKKPSWGGALGDVTMRGHPGAPRQPRDAGLGPSRGCNSPSSGWEAAPEGFALQPSAGSGRVLAGTMGAATPPQLPQSFFPLPAFFCSFLLLGAGTSIERLRDPPRAGARSCLALHRRARHRPDPSGAAVRGQRRWASAWSGLRQPSPCGQQAASRTPSSPAGPPLCPTPVPGVPGHGSRYPSGVEPSALPASPSREHPPHPSPRGTGGDPPGRGTRIPCAAPPVARSRGRASSQAVVALPPPRRWGRFSLTTCQRPWTLCQAWERRR